MVALKHSEKRVIEEAMMMGDGYVLDFSDRTFSEFFEDELGIQIYSAKYSINGTSKAKHLRAFLEIEDEYLVGKALRHLWSHRESISSSARKPEIEADLERRFFEVLRRLETALSRPRTDAIDRFSSDATLLELIDSIQRDVAANKPAAALDRLHTYCLKKFGHLLDLHGIPWEKSEPLHSRVGKYFKALDSKLDLRDASKQIIKNSIGVFEKFNHVRNNGSLAHDNELLSPAEARFVFDSIVALLEFIKTVEPKNFGQ
jgi:hypothetical protein